MMCHLCHCPFCFSWKRNKKYSRLGSEKCVLLLIFSCFYAARLVVLDVPAAAACARNAARPAGGASHARFRPWPAHWRPAFASRQCRGRCGHQAQIGIRTGRSFVVITVLRVGDIHSHRVIRQSLECASRPAVNDTFAARLFQPATLDVVFFVKSALSTRPARACTCILRRLARFDNLTLLGDGKRHLIRKPRWSSLAASSAGQQTGDALVWQRKQQVVLAR